MAFQISTKGEEMRNPQNPLVFMDLSISNRPPERILIELFADLMPKTTENFRALCVGNMGIGRTTGKPLNYKGSVFHCIYPHLGAEGGDFSKQDGTGGESIYGGRFPAESNPEDRSGPGILMTVNDRSNTCGSLFLICFTHNIFLDWGNHVVFGRVINGIVTVLKIQQAGQLGLVQITDCGEISEDYLSDKPQSSSVVVRKEESEANLQKEVPSEMPSNDPHDLKRVAEELRNQIDECKIYLKKKVAADKKRPNSQVGWPVIAASAGALILAGVAFFRDGNFRLVHGEHGNRCNY